MLRPAYNLTLIAAHLDHGWRKESPQDVFFCQKVAEDLKIHFIHAHLSAFIDDERYHGSQEDLGRRARRRFFEQLADTHQAQKIALAHHKDDQIETFLMRIIRGAGLAGLTSMKPRSGPYIRPLLSLYKSDIVSYLDKNAISYLVDYTNTSTLYLRNRVRQQVVPALEHADSRFKNNCLRTIANLQEADHFLDKLTEAISISLQHEKQSSALDLRKFQALELFMQKRVMLNWLAKERVPFTLTSSFFDEILRFLNTKRGGAHRLHPSWSLVKKGTMLFLKK